MREALKERFNAALGYGGLRLINSGWGPRGFTAPLRRLVDQGWRPRQIVDVGAFKGTWTVECLGICPDARYLLIDPLPSNRAALEDLESRHANVTAWFGAAGAKGGELVIHSHADQSSPLVAVDPGWRATESITVPVRTIDSFVASGEIAPPQLIKADVQGYELEVLRGATEALATADAVLLEVSFRELYAGQPLAHELIAFLGDRGFRIADVCTYAQGADGSLEQSDMLFLRSNRR
jgi:FkbM family methyltransferase